MSKLYPPQIEGTIPAFIKESGVLIIPFVMNKTVGWNEISGFIIKIKNIQNNEIVATYESENFNKEASTVQFEFIPDDFQISMFYKLQLAYYKINSINKKEYGYYSTVGIIKCTSEPEVFIDGFNNLQLYNNVQTYIGVYNQKEKDVSEKVYSYNFTIYDENDKILETSGEQLHNHENDDEIYESFDSFTMTKALKENKIYTIVYTVTTTNGIVKSSPKYRITQQSTIPPEVKATLIATMNEENGYVNLQLVGNKDEFDNEKKVTGTFLICRASSEDDYGSWSEIDRFALIDELPSSYNKKDFTIQHGFTYIYSFQQYNQIYSNRILSNEITANFEHSFLYDGERQLKIKYNPKVSSFKETILESKTNTLGGKYPFFFRNGNVAYKEFPISGLISYLSDEEELFLTDEDLFLEDLSNLKRQHTLIPGIKSTDSEYFNNMSDAYAAYSLQMAYEKREEQNSQENQIVRQKGRTTELTDYNIVAEKIFKMKVLEFLNDGKPKLFRSPTEGNFIIRLMNSSFTPEDRLGRMLYTFSTTATEIDDYNYQKLNEYGLVSIKEPDTKHLEEKIIYIQEESSQNLVFSLEEDNIKSIKCKDMVEGDQIKIVFAAPGNEERTIQIDSTGIYSIEFDESPQKISFTLKEQRGEENKGTITYKYYTTVLNYFNTYKSIKINDIPVIQLREDTGNDDIKEFFGLDDIKHKVTKYYFLNFTKESDAIATFQIGNTPYEFKEGENNYYFDKIDDIPIAELDSIPIVKLGAGVCLDISFQYREFEYTIEETNENIKRLKDEYLTAYDNIQNYIKFGGKTEPEQPEGDNESTDKIEDEPTPLNIADYETTLNFLKDQLTRAYNDFITALKEEVQSK